MHASLTLKTATTGRAGRPPLHVEYCTPRPSTSLPITPFCVPYLLLFLFPIPLPAFPTPAHRVPYLPPPYPPPNPPLPGPGAAQPVCDLLTRTLHRFCPLTTATSSGCGYDSECDMVALYCTRTANVLVSSWLSLSRSATDFVLALSTRALLSSARLTHAFVASMSKYLKTYCAAQGAGGRNCEAYACLRPGRPY